MRNAIPMLAVVAVSLPLLGPTATFSADTVDLVSRLTAKLELSRDRSVGRRPLLFLSRPAPRSFPGRSGETPSLHQPGESGGVILEMGPNGPHVEHCPGHRFPAVAPPSAR
jgi:hypothetical protein